MSEPDENRISFATACRVMLSFLDGATSQWVSDRFSLTPKEVHLARDHIEAAIKQHYSDQGEPITDFESFTQENVDDVIGLLVTWADLAMRPLVPIVEDDTGKKNGTSQGENGGSPDSP